MQLETWHSKKRGMWVPSRSLERARETPLACHHRVAHKSGLTNTISRNTTVFSHRKLSQLKILPNESNPQIAGRGNRKCWLNDKNGTIPLPTQQATSCPLLSSNVQTVKKQALEELTLVKCCSVPASQGLFTCCSWVSYPPVDGCRVPEPWGWPASSCEFGWLILRRSRTHSPLC